MIIILKSNPDEQQKQNLITWLHSLGLDTHMSQGEYQTILGLVGDTSKVDLDLIKSLEIVQDVKRIREPYKNVNRDFHPDDTVLEIGGAKIGGGNFQFIAGPCSVESEEQIIEVAKAVQKSGARLLRGGAFKPRTSPYAFQGMGAEGIRLLLEAKQATGMPIVTEIMNISQLPLFEEIDVVQVGARNMQNFDLLKELGHSDKVILLKRGLANTLEELLMSAEYIMAGGTERIILCERGIRTFETATRNTMDLSVIPVLQQLSHLPVVVDPSHATGRWELVAPMALGATACGADGLIIEVHNDPEHALCDGPQSLRPEKFAALMRDVQAIRPYADRSFTFPAREK